MRCLILLNGRDCRGLSEKDRMFYIKKAEESDFIICADGGVNTAHALGIRPDLIIGDMDSAEAGILRSLPKDRIIIYPREKDRTDGWLALHKAVELGYDEILVSPGISSRPDHSIANIQMLLSVPKGISARIVEPDLEILVLEGEGKIWIKGEKGERISLLPLSEKVEGVRLSGLKYPMENGSFSVKGTNGISNEMLGNTAEISIKTGMLGIFHYKNR